jgi:DNA-binding response OmpR family regulator
MNAVLKDAPPVSDTTGSDVNNRFQLRQSASKRGGPMGGGAYVATQRLLRVLIVDNDRDTTDTLAALVNLWGHDARPAYDGATGLAIAAAVTPDVVLLDIAMPEMDGCELAVHLRRDADLHDCFLIAMTGFGDEKHRRQCHEAGIDLFLIKPVEALVLETLLMLERRRLGRLQAASSIIEVESEKYGTAQRAVLV